MNGIVGLFLALMLLVSVVLTGIVRNRALAVGMLDRPNDRSSHTVPTPRGGGIGIVLAFSCASVVLWLCGFVDGRATAAILFGGSAVALVGYLDDRGSLSVRVRIVVHVAAAIVAVVVLRGMPPLQWGANSIDPGLIGDVIAILGIVWMLNLFNFMDGIDGIAGSQAVFMGAAGALLTLLGGGGSGPAFLAAFLAAASLGFLCWNWPPARIFMGDVGSGYLGYVIAVIALASARGAPAMPWVWLILSATFFVDATVTLFRRLFAGQAVYQAHRGHAYQRLSRRWGRHLLVTVAFGVVNGALVLPAAYLAAIRPDRAALVMAAVLVLLGVVAYLCGAGKPESER